MSEFRILKLAGIAAIGAGAFAAATPAQAGRCGGSYPVDAPTTLVEVARQCNVRLSDLREANPGVDPGDVRPGEHLAVPDEINAYAPVSASPITITDQIQIAAATDPRALATDDAGLTVSDAISNFRGDNGRAVHRIRVRDHRMSSERPVWLASDAPQGGRYSATQTLSYQKLSALRIHNASVMDPMVRYASVPAPSLANRLRLVDCTVREKSKAGASGKIRKIISTPEETFAAVDKLSDGDEFNCTLINVSGAVEPTPGVPSAHYGIPEGTGYRLPDYGKIGFAPSAAAPRGPATFALSGEVIDSYEGCLLLQTGSGGLWRLSSDQPTEDLLGRSVMVWGAPVVGGVCGEGPSMAVSHAIYAEPWPAN